MCELSFQMDVLRVSVCPKPLFALFFVFLAKSRRIKP